MNAAASTVQTPALKAVIWRDRVEASLWRRWTQDRDGDCRLRLFDLYSDFAKSTALHQFSRRPPYGLEKTDFEQFAYTGLLEALDRFDPLAGCSFKTFARYRIIGAVADGSLKSSEKANLYASSRRTERDRMQSIKLETGSDELDAIEQLRALVGSLATSILLETVTQETLESVPDLTAQTAFETVKWNQMKAALKCELENLPSREADIIRRHYLLGVNFKQIAELLQISKGRVSQLHSQAIHRLRARMKSKH